MNIEKKRFVYSLVVPSLVLLLIVLVRLLEVTAQWDLYWLGIYPRKWQGLIGILSSPLVHANWQHLLDNAVSFMILAAGLFYFYRDLALRVFIYNWLLTGLFVWIGARPAYHIGASGLIYGIASFLFFSGIIRRYVPLMAISLIVVFLYGSMVWGLFPLKEEISWESHLLGAIAGWLLALLYYNQGPQRPPASWELEEEEFDEEYWNQVLDEKLEKKKKK
jgi:membrane associated rhomboid family serine protease